MKIKKIAAVYFSPTGTTENTVMTAANACAAALGLNRSECECGCGAASGVEVLDMTLPEPRKAGAQFDEHTLVFFGTPVYAGRVPNVILKDLAGFDGNGALAVPVVSYGNRSCDDALIELRDILEDNGFHTVAAGAFIGEHSFSTTLAAGRPDAHDLQQAWTFGWKVGYRVEILSQKLEAGEVTWPPAPVNVPGTPKPYRGYYQPRDRKGVSIDIRKVKPIVGDACNNCGLCAKVCPMGSIDPEDVRNYIGICIKCGACIKKCPQKARDYEDPGYLYHKTELEEGLTRRAEPETFF